MYKSLFLSYTFFISYPYHAQHVRDSFLSEDIYPFLGFLIFITIGCQGQNDLFVGGISD